MQIRKLASAMLLTAALSPAWGNSANAGMINTSFSNVDVTSYKNVSYYYGGYGYRRPYYRSYGYGGYYRPRHYYRPSYYGNDYDDCY